MWYFFQLIEIKFIVKGKNVFGRCTFRIREKRKRQKRCVMIMCKN